MASAVIDLDDVMIPLNDTIFNRYRIDVNKLTSYKISRCKISDIEKSTILKAYRDAEIFKEAGLSKEAYQAIDLLHKLVLNNKLEVFINSNSNSQDVIDYKLELLHKEMSFIPDSNIKLNLIIPGQSNKKKIQACDIIVEDYINNIYTAEDYKYAFLIHKTHNKGIKLKNNIIRQLNVYEAVKSIKCLIDNNII